jgi:lipopolysaccharide export LptBFGC system permease protein LptF
MARLASKEKRPKEMTAGELVKQLKLAPKGEERYNKMMIELLEKSAIPLAVLLMGIIGMPLGTQLNARGRSSGIGVSLAVFLIYYLCLAGARGICETGALPPIIGVWVPDLFLLVACLYLLRRVANERPINILPGFLKTKRTV